jgi:hypothetical protein
LGARNTGFPCDEPFCQRREVSWYPHFFSFFSFLPFSLFFFFFLFLTFAAAAASASALTRAKDGSNRGGVHFTGETVNGRHQARTPYQAAENDEFGVSKIQGIMAK